MLHALADCCVLAGLLFACFLVQCEVSGLPVATCLSTQYMCRGGGCIPAFWQCDGDEDCADGSDETECLTGEAACSGFLCPGGQCIEMKWQCNGEKDCSDGSDEWPEMCGKGNATCTSSQFHCSNTRCVPRQLVCDGKDDCGDASDESVSVCPPPACGDQQFQCLPLVLCLPMAITCDGKDDCPDGSDESSEHCTSQHPPQCADSEFQCAPDHCIPEAWICDGHTDCDNEEDEAECDVSTDSTEHPSVREAATADNVSPEVEKKLCHEERNVYWMMAALAFLSLIPMSCIVLWCTVRRKQSLPLPDFVETLKKRMIPKRTQSSSSSYMLTDRRIEADED